MRTTFSGESRRGMALMVALMAMMVLGLLGGSLIVTVDTDDRISHSYAAEVDALFAANAGLQVGIKNAMNDAIWDPAGQWGDGILAVGGAPDLTEANKPNGSRIDTDGSVTGIAGSVYFDMAELRDAPTCQNCDPSEWARETGGAPYALPGADELPWAETGPTTSAYLPNGASYRLQFMGVPAGTTNPATAFAPDRIRILSTGTSGTSISGAAGGALSLFRGAARKASRTVLATYRVRDIGIWANSFFSGGVSDMTLQGGNLVRGSIHVLNLEGRSVAASFSGGGGMRNNYMGIDRLVAERIPTPDGNPQSLASELRVRRGNIEIDGNSTTIGQPQDVVSTAPYTVMGKGALDGVYMGSDTFPSRFVGNQPQNHWADVEDEYDADGFGLTFPDYGADAYQDVCNDTYATTNGWRAYQLYLEGKSGGIGMHGVYALDLSPVGDSFELLHDQTTTLATDLETVQEAIIGANSHHPEPRRTPVGASNGHLDFIYVGSTSSARTTIVGAFKHLPSASPTQENNLGVNCIYKGGGGGHGLLYLPAGATVDAGPDAQSLWDFVDRNWRRYGYAPMTDDEVNGFLGRPAGSAPNAAIGPGPIIDGVADGRFGRLLIQGVVLIADHPIVLGSIQAGSTRRTSIAYMGRGTFAGADTQGEIDTDARLAVDGYLLAYRQFPCVDSLGLMAPATVHVGGPSNPGQAGLMGAWYGGRAVEVDQNSHVVGSLVTMTASVGARTGNANELTQVPDLVRCLPPQMIGDWSYFVLHPISWSEH